MKKQVLLLSLLILLLPAFSLSAQNGASYRRMMAEISNRYDKSFVYESGLPLDQPYHGPALSGVNLQRDLRLLFRGSGLAWTQNGHYIVLRLRRRAAGPPDASLDGPFRIVYDTISPSRIASHPQERPMPRAELGLTRVSGADIGRSFALLGSPDVLRTLRSQPGVAEGPELSSGFTIRGGTSYDNRYLLDGVPVYEASHFYGFFSAFNPDVIDRVDLYKDGFPARFGGAASGILSVTTRDGDFRAWHGNFGIGFLDGRIQVEGPLRRDRTSVNLSLRRSWADALIVPALKLLKVEGSRDSGSYGFYDLNFKMTHRYSGRSRLSLLVYGGGDDLDWQDNYGGYDPFAGRFDPYEKSSRERHPAWGNNIASLAWDYSFSDLFSLRLTSWYTRFHASYADETVYESSGVPVGDSVPVVHTGSYARLRSDIDDAGVNAAFVWTPQGAHSLCFGAAAKYLRYATEYVSGMDDYTRYDFGIHVDRRGEFAEDRAYPGAEASLYVEDSFRPTGRLRFDLGLRGVAYAVDKTVRARLEPRFSVSWQAAPAVSLRASYARMNQFHHQFQSQYYTLPNALWLPSTADFLPIRSDQFSLGGQALLRRGIRFGLEGWYKRLEHLYEYNGAGSELPPFPGLPQKYSEGQGTSYGAEFSFDLLRPKWHVSTSYTLSWNLRRFPEIYPDWYRDRFDSRHNFHLEAVWRPSGRFDCYAAWHFHSGTRATMPFSRFYDAREGRLLQIYGEPFNVKLPDYHRLDLGASFHRTNFYGLAETWNVSIYKAYCRMNAVSAVIVQRGSFQPGKSSRFAGKARGFIPVIPSVSYRLSF